MYLSICIQTIANTCKYLNICLLRCDPSKQPSSLLWTYFKLEIFEKEISHWCTYPKERERESDHWSGYMLFFLFGKHFVKINCFFPLKSRCNFHAYVTCTIGWGPCCMKWRSLIRISHSIPIGIKTFYNNNAYALEMKNLTQNFKVYH